MSESGTGAPDAPDDAPEAQPVTPPPHTAGAMLRGLRESAGVDIALVASVLKVPLPKLQALEADRFDLLPDLTFARGLASAFCRAFGVDPAPVLERMPAAAPGLRTPEQRHANPPFRRASDQPAPLGSGNLARPLLMGAIALLVVAALLWLLPTAPVAPDAPDAPSGEAVPEPAPPPFVTDDGPVPTPPPPVTEPPADAAPAEPTADAASAPASAPAAAAASTPASAASRAAADAVLGLVASGETWVSVRDVADKVLINRTLAAGDTLNVGGELPLSVTIGRKNAVAVTVRGKPFDHKALGRSEVARFTVK